MTVEDALRGFGTVYRLFPAVAGTRIKSSAIWSGAREDYVLGVEDGNSVFSSFVLHQE